jgi:hypothetical protein
MLGHAIGQIKDLPVPAWLFYYGAVIVLVVSFVGLGVLWRRPLLARTRRGRPLPEAAQRFLLSRGLRAVLGAVGFGLFVVISLSALVGDAEPSRNLAPTFVYVIFWVGLVPVSVLLGNVFAVLNPWRAAADAVAWVWARSGRAPLETFLYPERLGRWPGAVLLLAFAALELCYQDAADPRSLGIAILIYSWVAWVGMALFGRETWLARGEAFAIYYGLLARLAPFGVREDGRRELVVRPPLSGLAVRDWLPGTVAFVAVMLGSVGFDGVSRTTWWLDRRFEIERQYAFTNPGLSETLVTLMYLGGLLGAVAVVALAYLATVHLARIAARVRRPLARVFVGSLVPIAMGYAIAHYFSLLILQGQFAVPLASDPLGRGWDLLGTADFSPNLGLLTPNAIWYVQVVALVVAHIFGLVLAHDRAVALIPSARRALQAQYALLALMVLYTCAGLWLLSHG